MIKFVFRWAFRLLLLAIVAGIGLLLLKDILVKEIAQKRLQRETGLQVRIGAMQTALLSSTVSIQNLVIYNPADFGGGPLLDIPDLHLEYAYGSSTNPGMKLKLLRLDIRELNIIQNNLGETNIITILDKVAPDILRKSSGGQKHDSFGGIDMLNLSVGKVRYIHLAHPKRNQEIELAMRHAIVQNIRTQDDLAGVFLKVLVRAGISIYAESRAGGRSIDKTSPVSLASGKPQAGN